MLTTLCFWNKLHFVLMYYSLGELLDVIALYSLEFLQLYLENCLNYFFLYFLLDFNIKSQDLVNGIFTLLSESFLFRVILY